MAVSIDQRQRGTVTPNSKSLLLKIDRVIDSRLWEECVQLQRQGLEERALGVGDLQHPVGLEHHGAGIAKPYQQGLIVVGTTGLNPRCHQLLNLCTWKVDLDSNNGEILYANLERTALRRTFSRLTLGHDAAHMLTWAN